MGAMREAAPPHWACSAPAIIADHIDRCALHIAGIQAPAKESESQSGSLRRPWDGSRG